MSKNSESLDKSVPKRKWINIAFVVQWIHFTIDVFFFSRFSFHRSQFQKKGMILEKNASFTSHELSCLYVFVMQYDSIMRFLIHIRISFS